MRPFKKFPQHKLSRSNTRITLLEYCEKKYFFNYYTHSLKNIDQNLRKLALQLKKLKSLEMRMGEKTHYLISDYLKLLQQHLATPESIQQLKDAISSEMRAEFLASKEKDHNNTDFDNQGGLSEHFYGEDIDERLHPTIEQVWNNLDALINSQRHSKLIEMLNHQDKVYIEHPRNPDFEAMKVATNNLPQLQNINIMASPDFGVIFHQDNYLLLDRKSGKEPQFGLDISDQIKVYALKLLLNSKKHTNLAETKIEGYEIYLPSTREYGGIIQQTDIDDIIEKIHQDINFQKTFLIDQDPLRNQPLASTAFSRTTSHKKCETCTFRKVCEQLKQHE